MISRIQNEFSNSFYRIFMLTVRKLFELNTLLFQEKLGEKNNRNAYLIHLSIFFFLHIEVHL